MKYHTAKEPCENCKNHNKLMEDIGIPEVKIECDHVQMGVQLLSLSDEEFASVSLGLVQAYEVELVRSGGLYVQHLPDGDFIQLDNDETVPGVFKFCKFINSVKP